MDFFKCMKVFIENVSVGIFFIECLPLYPVPYVLFLLSRVRFFYWSQSGARTGTGAGAGT